MYNEQEQWTRNPLCSAKPRTGRHIKGDIQAFGKIYKGPEDELADIKQAYLNCKGDTDQLTESVLCVQYPEEEPRIGNLIQ